MFLRSATKADNPSFSIRTPECELASVVLFFSAATMCFGCSGGTLSRFFLALLHNGHHGFSQLHNFKHKTFHPHRLMSVSDSCPSLPRPPSPLPLLLLLPHLLLNELPSSLLCSGFIFFPYIVPVSAGFHTAQGLWLLLLLLLLLLLFAKHNQLQPTREELQKAATRSPECQSKYITANEQNIQCNYIIL